MSRHPNDTDLKLIREARAAVAARPADAEAWIQLGRLLFEPAHQSQEAIEALNRAIEAEPTNADAKFWLAKVYFHDFASAAVADRILEQALAVDGRDPRSLSLLASVRKDLGSTHAETLPLIRRAVAAAPDWRTPREQLVVALIDAGRREEAEEELLKLRAMAIRHPPDDPLDVYFEEVVTGRSRPSHEVWLDTVARLLDQAPKSRA